MTQEPCQEANAMESSRGGQRKLAKHSPVPVSAGVR